MPEPAPSPGDRFLPPDLALDPDDVVEAVEIVLDPEEHVASFAEERSSGRDGFGTRREARERALALLFEADQRGVEPLADILDQVPVPPDGFAAALVVGVSDHLAELDDRIRANSVGWSLERMPAIDRALLRLGTYELIHTDVPVGACISEAVELAKRYSTDDSHKFVNGMLARVADQERGRT